MIDSESSLEHDFLVRLDFDPTVERYEEQPVRIEYRDAAGDKHTYTPDVLVHYRQDISQGQPSQAILYEVKYRKDLFDNWREIKPKIRAGRAFARQRDWRFKIITEREIRTPYLENARFLRPYLRFRPSDEEQGTLLDTLPALGASDPESLLWAIHQEAVKRAELLPALWHLIATGKIYTDLSQPLNMRSLIWVANPD
jgi:hypothetical protein